MGGRYPQTGYSYTIGSPLPARRPVATSKTEVTHLVVAALVLTLDIAILFGGLALYAVRQEVLLLATAAGATLTGFVAHEMAHKVSAQRRGYWAEFRLSPFGLLISVVTAVVGFLFAAPGATMIGGMANPRDWGRTSLAGPMTNFAFSVAFLAGASLAGEYPGGQTVKAVLLFLALINGWFAAFNMIPIGPLDGAKVFRWSRPTWAVGFSAFAVLAILLYLLVPIGALPGG